jgi:excisionase family DNA binding protein
MNETLMQISEVSQALGISDTTTRRLIKAGVLPAVRVGGQIRIDRNRLRDWISSGGGAIRGEHSEAGLANFTSRDGDR